MKLKLGEELTDKMRALSDCYGVSLVGIARKAESCSKKVACYRIYSLLPCTGGTAITVDDTFNHVEWRRIINRYCDENKLSDEQREARIAKELASLIPHRDELRKIHCGNTPIIIGE